MAHEVSRRALVAEIYVQFAVDKAVIGQFSANVSVFPCQYNSASTSITDDSKLKPSFTLETPPPRGYYTYQ